MLRARIAIVEVKAKPIIKGCRRNESALIAVDNDNKTMPINNTIPTTPVSEANSKISLWA